MSEVVTGLTSWLFEVFMPRQTCMKYEQDVIVLHIVSDALIAISYYSIPAALVYFVFRRKDLRFGWILWMFALFIISCGTTHLFNIWAIWQPFYRLDGFVKLLTGLISVTTAFVLWPLIPKLLAIPSPEQLRHANALLRSEITERARAQEIAEDQAQRLQQLSLELTQTEERERRHLAQMLHDHVQQLLAVCRMTVATHTSQMPPGELREDLESCQNLLGESIQICRSLSVQLSPVILYDAGLVQALRWLAERMRESNRLEVHVEACELEREPPQHLSSLMFQAARELLFNVVKHANALEATIALSQEGSLYRLRVLDEGKGFDVDEVQHRPAGASFGLFNISQRATALGGRLHLESADGRTCIALELPLSLNPELTPVPAQPERNAPVPPAPLAGRLRTILIDDHQVMRDTVKNQLRRIPEVVVVGEASDGLTAVELALAVEPDLIIMDVAMPGINGIVATRQIRQKLGADTTIIALSMYEDEDLMEEMMRAGADAYLAKTASVEELKAIIEAQRGAAE